MVNKGGLGGMPPRVPRQMRGIRGWRRVSELSRAVARPPPWPGTEFCPRGFAPAFHRDLPECLSRPASHSVSGLFSSSGTSLAPGKPCPSSGSENLCVCPPACPDHSLSVSSAGCEPPGAWKPCHRHSRTPCSVPRPPSRAEAGRAPELACLLQRLLTGAACPGLDGAGRKRGRGQLRPRGGGPDNNSRAIPLEPARDATHGGFLPVLPVRPPPEHPPPWCWVAPGPSGQKGGSSKGLGCPWLWLRVTAWSLGIEPRPWGREKRWLCRLVQCPPDALRPRHPLPSPREAERCPHKTRTRPGPTETLGQDPGWAWVLSQG